MNKVELIKHLNTLRKENKNKWVIWNGQYNGTPINYMAFDTWVKILDSTYTGNFCRNSSVMGLNVTGYKNFLNNAL